VDKVRDTAGSLPVGRVAPDYGSGRYGVAVANPTDRFSEDSRAGRTYRADDSTLSVRSRIGRAKTVAQPNACRV
jgi:hypothetical protein